MDALSKEFKYFLKHHDALFSQYPNKHIVIKDKRVLFDDDSFEGALNKAIGAGLEVGTFIVQLCTAGEEGYTQTFYSPHVRFA